VEQVWVFERLAVSVARIDFLDPAVSGEIDARERGVRVEVRPALSVVDGSIYASSTTTVHAAICRIDLLESAPGAGDRMHWHPHMHDAEPGDRIFDPELSVDPVRWLTRFLDDRLPGFLTDQDLDLEPLRRDLVGIRASAEDIGRTVADGLTQARTPWPPARHDERGMATFA
jgi:hypothetical protein